MEIGVNLLMGYTFLNAAVLLFELGLNIFSSMGLI